MSPSTGSHIVQSSVCKCTCCYQHAGTEETFQKDWLIKDTCFAFRRTRRRSCAVSYTLAVSTPRCVKRCGLSCWVTISLECQKRQERRFVISTNVAIAPIASSTWNSDPWSHTLHHKVDEQVRMCYQQTMREWLGCEEIVRQREKEQHAAALAKCSSAASMDGSSQKMHHDSTVSNEVKQWYTLRFESCKDR